MADKKCTLLELHLGDGTVQIGPATIGEGSTDATEPESEGSDDDGDDGCSCPGRKAGKLLLVLLGIGLLALAIKAALGGDDELDELEDLADLDEGEA